MSLRVKWPRSICVAAIIRAALDTEERCSSASFIASFRRGHTGPSFIQVKEVIHSNLTNHKNNNITANSMLVKNVFLHFMPWPAGMIWLLTPTHSSWITYIKVSLNLIRFHCSSICICFFFKHSQIHLSFILWYWFESDSEKEKGGKFVCTIQMYRKSDEREADPTDLELNKGIKIITDE